MRRNSPKDFRPQNSIRFQICRKNNRLLKLATNALSNNKTNGHIDNKRSWWQQKHALITKQMIIFALPVTTEAHDDNKSML